MRVPLGKLTVIDTPSLGNERAKRGLATSRCLSPALRGSTSASTLSFIICLSPNFYQIFMSPNFYKFLSKFLGVGVGVRKIKELAYSLSFDLA